MAHRFISRRRNNSVAFGAERTFSEPCHRTGFMSSRPGRRSHRQPHPPRPAPRGVLPRAMRLANSMASFGTMLSVPSAFMPVGQLSSSSRGRVAPFELIEFFLAGATRRRAAGPVG